MNLRPYQSALKQSIYQAWHEGAANVLAVLPTGGGKTVLFAEIMREFNRPAVAIAHRQELVSQISLALARDGVPHRVIGPKQVARNCSSLHLAELGRNYIQPVAPVAVAGVDTLVRMPASDPFCSQVALWVQDEAHHVLASNKWGAAAAMFPNARGLGVTATPRRADKKGLGRHADGLMDSLVVGPPMRELIDAGYLTDYKIFAPPSDVDLSQVPIGAGGDYSPQPLRAAVHKSRIVGDVVTHYKRLADGKLGVTFAVDVESAGEIAQAHRAAGVPSEVVSAKTPDLLRAAILRRFRAREVLQLVNVDLFGEGFDLPAIEVVSMARPTASYGLFVQQFGRALRILEGKERALILDHVGNVHRHGLPDAPQVWSLDAGERRERGAGNGTPVSTCPRCTGVYERYKRACPFCGHAPEPAGRGSPEQVDGDLVELSPDALDGLRREVARVDGSPRVPPGMAPAVVGAINRNHWERQQAQAALRDVMARWGGAAIAAGFSYREAQVKFFHRFGIDVLSAQALGRAEAEQLKERVANDLA